MEALLFGIDLATPLALVAGYDDGHVRLLTPRAARTPSLQAAAWNWSPDALPALEDEARRLFSAVRKRYANPPEAPCEAVLCVPSCAGGEACEALHRAAEGAGFVVRRYVRPAQAIAQGEESLDGTLITVSLDLGHVEVGVYEVFDGERHARAYSGFAVEHGSLFVENVASWVSFSLGCDLHEDPPARASLVALVRHALATTPRGASLRIDVSRLVARSAPVEVSVEVLAYAFENLAERVVSLINECLRKAGIKRTPRTRLVLAGRQWGAAALATRLGQHFGAPCAVREASTAALEAALEAGRSWRNAALEAGAARFAPTSEVPWEPAPESLWEAPPEAPAASVWEAPSEPRWEAPPEASVSDEEPAPEPARPAVPPPPPVAPVSAPRHEAPTRVHDPMAATLPAPAAALTPTLPAPSYEPPPAYASAPQGYAPLPQGYGPIPQGYAPPGYAMPRYVPPGYVPPGYGPPGYAPPGYGPPGYAPPGYVPQAYAPLPPWLAAPQPWFGAPPPAQHAPAAPPSDSALPLGTRLPTGEVVSARLPREGAFVAPRSARALYDLPINRTASADEVERPLVLAALLAQIGMRPHLSGTLMLSRDQDAVAIGIDNGSALLHAGDWPRLSRIFMAGEGRWSISPEHIVDAPNATRDTLTGLAFAALRGFVRELSDAQVLEALGDKARLAPTVRPERVGRLQRVRLMPHEDRSVKRSLDATIDLSTLMQREGAMLRVVLLLDLFDILAWAPPVRLGAENAREELARRVARLSTQNHFEVLSVHWTASGDEILPAWRKFDAEYGAEGPWHAVDPALARAAHDRGRAAWAVLERETSRIRYRVQAYPTVNRDMLIALINGRANTLAIAGQTNEAEDMRRLLRELQTSATLRA